MGACKANKTFLVLVVALIRVLVLFEYSIDCGTYRRYHTLQRQDSYWQTIEGKSRRTPGPLSHHPNDMNANAKSQHWGPMAICRGTVTVSAEQKQDDEHAISWNPKRHEREKSASRPNSESAIYHTGIVTAEQEQQAQNPWRVTKKNRKQEA
ncbi:hypothetical protein DFJ58DRAFT_797652 [Suillus subalutaceus]|uniref:uncharacterized protein n=1 Tax=Suillus subalutaceus TaxID=48586 RepID=UPI001B85FBB6|nr:uncharacterized protein DFJ58DRAFT_797652 [Suillus subalutaceus]KAG1847531.1 hypothetical protein DFJ58DRAFT_797652 [Suillus subalutaceus]